MAESSVADSFTRKVMLLKCSDFVKKDDKMVMLTLVELGVLRRSPTGRYQKNVPFSSKMSDEEVRETLRQSYPLFNLTRRFSCASFSQKSSTFIFHGDPRVWDGAMIKKTVKGDSVLYIILEDDQMPQESAHETNDATNSSAQGTSEIQNNQVPFQSALLNSSEMPQESVHETNNATNSSAPVALSNLNQSTLSDVSATVMVLDFSNTDQPENAATAGTSEIQNNQVPFQSALLNSSEMPQESAHGTNNATNSSAPGKKFVIY